MSIQQVAMPIALLVLIGCASARAENSNDNAAALHARLAREFGADDKSVTVAVSPERPYLAQLVVPLSSRSGGVAALRLGSNPEPSAVAHAVLAEHSAALGILGNCEVEQIQDETSVEGETVVRFLDTFDLNAQRARIYGSHYRVYLRDGMPSELRAETPVEGGVDLAAQVVAEERGGDPTVGQRRPPREHRRRFDEEPRFRAELRRPQHIGSCGGQSRGRRLSGSIGRRALAVQGGSARHDLLGVSHDRPHCHRRRDERRRALRPPRRRVAE